MNAISYCNGTLICTNSAITFEHRQWRCPFNRSASWSHLLWI